jgi:hypothetical protein
MKHSALAAGAWECWIVIIRTVGVGWRACLLRANAREGTMKFVGLTRGICLQYVESWRPGRPASATGWEEGV